MAWSIPNAVAEGAKIFVIGGKPDDPFWSKVKRGADDAGLLVKAQGGSVTWLGPQTYDISARRREADPHRAEPEARCHRRAGLGAEAQDEALKAVVDAGVPLIIYNAGRHEAATSSAQELLSATTNTWPASPAASISASKAPRRCSA
jgi:simple sugar transport system substrate-binding protein